MRAGPVLLLVGVLLGEPSRVHGQGSPGAWLAGCWELREGNRVTLEMWMPPAGGLLLGASRTLVDGRVSEFEQVRITARGDTLIYAARPSGQPEAEFRAIAPAGDLLVFENPRHDFPQRIIYRRLGPDSLVARIEGPGPNDTVRGRDFPMRRVSCTPAPSR